MHTWPQAALQHSLRKLSARCTAALTPQAVRKMHCCTHSTRCTAALTPQPALLHSLHNLHCCTHSTRCTAALNTVGRRTHWMHCVCPHDHLHEISGQQRGRAELVGQDECETRFQTCMSDHTAVKVTCQGWLTVLHKQSTALCMHSRSLHLAVEQAITGRSAVHVLSHNCALAECSSVARSSCSSACISWSPNQVTVHNGKHYVEDVPRVAVLPP
jgi:hypothetical protein